MTDHPSADKEATMNFVEYVISVRNFCQFIIRSFFKLLIKRGFILLLFLIIGSLTGWKVFNPDKNCYITESVFRYTVQEKKVYGEMIKKLQYFIEIRDDNKISQDLHISAQDAKKLLNAEAVNIKDGPLFEDVTSENLPFYVRISLMDTSGYQGLDSCLLYYFNNNPIALSHNQLEYKELNERIERITNDINFLQKAEKKFLRNNYRRNLNKDTAVIHELSE